MLPRAGVGLQYIDGRRGLITKVSDTIWEYAEVGLHEHRSAQLMQEAFEEEGFEIQHGVAGMPTAFVAVWGTGSPVLGFLGEYDALPGLSQTAQPVQEELVSVGAGHACGHNLLGAGSFGAAIGLKEQMVSDEVPGTIKYFGCPAEEAFSGKSFMARQGYFKDCDICLTWHPGAVNRVRTGTSLAMDSICVSFQGRTAHAAADPYRGRSALDAVQLMSMGVEFLREHMHPSYRLHYIVSRGGQQPNVVPSDAELWLYIRAPERHQVDTLCERVLKCAEGAACMTETTYQVEYVESIWNVLNNRTLEKMLEDCMKRVGPPQFGLDERRFAEEISRSISAGQKKMFLANAELAPEEYRDCLLNDTVLPPKKQSEPRGSTDVADVSWCCPTAQFTTACSVLGTPGHSWQKVAQAGMGIGHEGMLTAAKVLVEAGLQIMVNPDLVRGAQDEFADRTADLCYQSSMPEDAEPAFHQLAEHCDLCSED